MNFRAELISRGADPLDVDAFIRYHTDHPEIWANFQRFAFEVIGTGKKHYSAMDILGRIRWYVEVETKGAEEWKVNNNYAPMYARVFVLKFPEHGNFFSFRRLE